MWRAHVLPKGISGRSRRAGPAAAAVGLAAGAMILAGCGNSGSVEAEPVDDDEVVVAEEGGADSPAGAAEAQVVDADIDDGAADAADGAGEGADGAGEGDDATQPEAAGDDAAAEVMALAGRQLDGTVLLNGFEITVTDVTATDLDLEASADGEVTHRFLGVELQFHVDVHNATSGPGAPSGPISLRWDEGDTGNVYDVPGGLEVRDVPSNNSSSGQLVVTVPADGLESFDEASTRLVFGPDGSATAQLPVGDLPELVTRLPMSPPFEEQTMAVGDVDVVLTHAQIFFHDQQNQHVPEGTALLELTYDLDNQGDSRSCSSRGSGAWALTLPNGNGVVDLGVSERCVREGQTELEVLTGFDIDEDYAGTYTLVHERSGLSGDVSGELEFTLEEVEGLPASDRG